MELHERIIKYIEKHHPISYTSIVNVAVGKGFNEYQVLNALDKIGNKLKKIVRKEEVWYDLIPTQTPIKTPTHISWLTKNYPRPNNFIMPFPEIDLSHLFLKTLDHKRRE